MAKFKQLILSNLFIKINSFIIAFLLWHTLANTITISVWHDLPLSFFNVEESQEISAPKIIKVQLMGKKNILNNFNRYNLSLHIDAKTLSYGQNPYILTSDNLYCPSSIKLADYIPKNLSINVKEANK